MNKRIITTSVSLMLILIMLIGVLALCGCNREEDDEAVFNSFVEKEEDKLSKYAFPLNPNAEDGRYLMKSDAKFKYTEGTNIFGFDYSILQGVINAKESYVLLEKDGSITMRLIISDAGIDVLNGVFKRDFVTDFWFSEIMNDYVKSLFPGAALENAPEMLRLIKGSLGMRFVGIEGNDADVQAVFNGINVPSLFPEGAKLPKGFGIEVKTVYYMKDVSSNYSGDYTAVYVGGHSANTEPFLLMTLNKATENTKETVNFSIEFLRFNVVAKRVN